MTVKELIEKLKEFDEKMQIEVEGESGFAYEIIEAIKQNDFGEEFVLLTILE